MTSTNNHGGRRPGAGRPRSASSIAQQNEIIKNKVRPQVEGGLERLGDAYIPLMHRAIIEALGDEEEGRRPNVMLLRMLIEMGPKVIGADDGEKESLVTNMVREHLERVTHRATESEG